MSLICGCKRRMPGGQAVFGFRCIQCKRESAARVGEQGRLCSSCCKAEGRCIRCGFPKKGTT